MIQEYNNLLNQISIPEQLICNLLYHGIESEENYWIESKAIKKEYIKILKFFIKSLEKYPEIALKTYKNFFLAIKIIMSPYNMVIEKELDNSFYRLILANLLSKLQDSGKKEDGNKVKKQNNISLR